MPKSVGGMTHLNSLLSCPQTIQCPFFFCLLWASLCVVTLLNQTFPFLPINYITYTSSFHCIFHRSRRSSEKPLRREHELLMSTVNILRRMSVNILVTQPLFRVEHKYWNKMKSELWLRVRTLVIITVWNKFKRAITLFYACRPLVFFIVSLNLWVETCLRKLNLWEIKSLISAKGFPTIRVHC